MSIMEQDPPLWAQWDPAGGDPDCFARENTMFIRPSVPNMVHGVRSAAPLPPDAAWSVTFDRHGSHAAAGVATANSTLSAQGYGFVLGQDGNSWALCFGTGAGTDVLAASGGNSSPWLPAGPAYSPAKPFRIRFRLEAGKKLHAAIPGAAEKVVVEDLPQGVSLYAAAATVFGDSQVTIRPFGRLEAEEQEQQESKDQAARQKQEAEDLLNPNKPYNEHWHRWGTCQVCPKCKLCTGWGPSCVKVFGKDRSADAGKPCGCGQGEGGCQGCKLCRSCCAEHDAALDDAIKAAAALLSRPVPLTHVHHGSCPVRNCRAMPPAAAPAPSNGLPSFPSPFSYREETPRCLLELQLLKLAGAIRDKPRWIEKLQDAEIVGRWKAEAAAQGASEASIEYVFELLTHEATQQSFGTEGGVMGVFTYDSLVPEDLRQALVQQVARLEALPPDWHPGSDEQVLDLVHPSLYCLVYGVTKQLPEGTVNLDNCLRLIGSGSRALPPNLPGSTAPMQGYESRQDQSAVSQWLPTNFEVDASGDVRPLSYINNLHPKEYKELYGVVSHILGLLRPLFERVLASLVKERSLLINATAESWYDDFDGDQNDDEAYENYFETREPKQPKVPDAYVPLGPPAAVDLKGRRLQVIVKLANIILTPDKPRYTGGSWHVEGMRNEHIISTGIYYYDQDNISDSHLAFRVSVEEPEYEQNDNRGVEAIYGLSDQGALNQVLGQVSTLEGRCLCFPNTYQHQVQPFELLDKSRPGHRKILVYFLVDPSQSVLSTSEIPPQQAEWWKQEVFGDTATVLNAMPPEVMDVVGGIVDTAPGPECPYSLERARGYREQLMHERKYYVEAQNENHYEREFSLCEH